MNRFNTATPEAISSAEAYEDLMVNALFGEWAPRLTQEADLTPESSVLDVACGTGVLTREIKKQLNNSSRLVGLDPNTGMLTVASRMLPEVEWVEGSAEALPFKDKSFDVVLSQFGIMFFQNRKQFIKEAHRVLKPGGRLVVSFWDSLKNTPAYAKQVALFHECAGTRAAEALHAPFVLGDSEEINQLAEKEGFRELKKKTINGLGRFPSVQIMTEADLRGWLPIMGVHLDEEKISEIVQKAHKTLEVYIQNDGTVVFDSPAHIIIGIK